MNDWYVIKTMEDFEHLCYSSAGADWIRKSGDPLLTSTAGVYNEIYGELAYSQLNTEGNFFQVLPKYPHANSGIRMITARPEEVGLGYLEGGNIPVTKKFTFEQKKAAVRNWANSFEVSETMEMMAQRGIDDTFGSLAQRRPLQATHHAEMLNRMLLHDVSADALAGQTGGGVAGDRSVTSDLLNWPNFETVDRQISSKSERDAYNGSYNEWWNPYHGTEFDRDSVTTWDSYVDHTSGEGTRELEDDLIRDLNQNVLERGGNPTFYFTGHDSYNKMIGLYSGQVRYQGIVGTQQTQITVNGVSTATGIGVGINIPTIYNKPVFLSKDVKKDTISRIYLCDTSDPEGNGVPRLGMRMFAPTQYFEGGMSQGQPIVTGKFTSIGIYRTMGELICTAYNAQGKIRDLE